jgi:SulP family sulfate permease
MGRKPGSDVFRTLGDHPGDEIFPGLLITRTEGRLYFANASWVIDKLWPLVQQAAPQVLVLDCDAIPDITYTALKSLTEFEEQLSEADVSLWLAGLNSGPLNAVERSPLGVTLGHERIYYNLEQAVEAYTQRNSDGANKD